MDRLRVELTEVIRRIQGFADLIARLTSRVKWAEQRIRELGKTGAAAASSTNSRGAAGSWFLTTTNVSAASGATMTPGSGTADQIVWSGSAWTTIASGVTIGNGTEKATTATSGIYVWCVPDANGMWWVTVPYHCTDWA